MVHLSWTILLCNLTLWCCFRSMARFWIVERKTSRKWRRREWGRGSGPWTSSRRPRGRPMRTQRTQICLKEKSWRYGCAGPCRDMYLDMCLLFPYLGHSKSYAIHQDWQARQGVCCHSSRQVWRIYRQIWWKGTSHNYKRCVTVLCGVNIYVLVFVG